MNKKSIIKLLVETFPRKPVFRRYRIYIDNKGKTRREVIGIIIYEYEKTKKESKNNVFFNKKLDEKIEKYIPKKECEKKKFYNKKASMFDFYLLYIYQTKNAWKYGYDYIEGKELWTSVDAYRKSIKKIENKPIETLFTRRDIVEFALSIYPNFITDKSNKWKLKEYLKKVELKLGPGSYRTMFGDTFGTNETLRKELLKYIKEYIEKIEDSSIVEDREGICIINVTMEDYTHLQISLYENEKVTSKQIEWENLQTYIDSVNNGMIDCGVMKMCKTISNLCRKKINEMLYHTEGFEEYYLIMSPFSVGIINSYFYHKDDKLLYLISGNFEEIVKKVETFQTEES